MGDQFYGESSGVKRKIPSKQADQRDRIQHIFVPFQSASVILMDHPASLTLYKYVSVTVVSGTVSINGFQLTKKESINAFSSEKTGLIEIKSESYDSIWKKKTTVKQLGEHLSKLIKTPETVEKVLQKMDNTSVVVFIKRIVLPPSIEFAEFHFERAFQFKFCKRRSSTETYWLHSTEQLPIQFDEQHEKLASEIAAAYRSSSLLSDYFPRILVCGARNTGKSTTLQYLINKILSRCECVYYLDTDPGQPEFTPPGVVSLTKVVTPIIGPSFFHQHMQSEMRFVGDVSPSYLDLYLSSISKLTEEYVTKYDKNPLFINTMGGMEGLGLICLQNIMTITKPTIMIEIVRKGEASMFDYRDYLEPDSQYFQICCDHPQKRGAMLSPKFLSELSVLSYFGKCRPPYLQVTPINEITPFMVSPKKIAIFVFPGGSIPPYRLRDAVNGSVVAMCCVPEESIVDNNDSDCPKTLESDPDNECLGYGIVRAFDEKNNLLYVVTPLNKEKIQGVNAILKGGVMVPDCIFLKQEIFNVPMPFTNEYAPTYSDDDDDDDLNEISMLSLSCLDETNKSKRNVNLGLKCLLENFCVPANKRYSQKYSENSKEK